MIFKFYEGGTISFIGISSLLMKVPVIEEMLEDLTNLKCWILANIMFWKVLWAEISYYGLIFYIEGMQVSIKTLPSTFNTKLPWLRHNKQLALSIRIWKHILNKYCLISQTQSQNLCITLLILLENVNLKNNKVYEKNSVSGLHFCVTGDQNWGNNDLQTT